jgi:hypothetical protein
MFQDFLATDRKRDDKDHCIVKAIEYLKLPMDDPEALTEYSDIILDKWKLRDHDCIMRFLKSNEYIDNKLNELNFKGVDVKNLTNSYNKLNILRQFETRHGINVWAPQTPTDTEMDSTFYNLIKTVFRTKLTTPQTPEELVKFYGTLVKSATHRNFVKVTKGQVSINTDFVTKHLELNGYKNERRTGFSPEAMEHFGIETRTQSTEFVDASTLGLDA